MASGDSQEPGLLHEKLKDQVTISIRESLEKATSILSNLHRVQSYLDIIKAMSLSRSTSNAEGIRNALEQVRSIRNDTATLLQSIYLTEIGLQSLHDFDKPGNLLSSVMPILTDAITTPSLSSGVSIAEGTTQGGSDVMVVNVDVPGDEMGFADSGGTSSGTTISGAGASGGGLPAKKTFAVVITSCSLCGRKFATQRTEDHQLCKTCRPTSHLPPTTTSIAMDTPLSSFASAMPVSSEEPPMFTSTPFASKKSARPGKRTTLPPMSCKICGVSFHYKRCLFRHLKENHSGIDITNLHKYIEASPVPVEKKPKTSSKSSSSLVAAAGISSSSSLNVTVGSEIDPSIITLNTVSASEHGDLPPTTSMGTSTQGASVSVAASSSELSESLGAGSLLGALSLDQDLSAMENPGAEGDDDGREKAVSGGAQFTCSICAKAFDRPYRLHRHMQIHNPNRPRVTCHICDRTFTRVDTLENHIKCLHSEDRPFKCHVEMCTKAFATQSALFHHQKTHTDGKPYNCMECNSSFSLLNEYKHHMRESHADTQDLRCSDCYKLFTSREELSQHRLVEHRLECELCGKTFARLAYLKMHIRIHDGDNLFNCQFCSTGFDTEYAYKQHLKVHPEYHSAKRTYHCQVCDKSFQHPSNLLVHFRSQRHHEKTIATGINTSSILTTIQGDLSPDMCALVDEVTMGADDDSLIQSIADTETFQTAVSSSATFVPTTGQNAAFVDAGTSTTDVLRNIGHS